MKYSIDKQEQFTIFKVEEEKLNSIVAPQLKAELVILNNEGNRNVILNMNSVQFIDSSGLSAILVGNRLCENDGGDLILTEVNDNVLRLIRISQLDTILNIIPTLQESIDYIIMDELDKELRAGDESLSDE